MRGRIVLVAPGNVEVATWPLPGSWRADLGVVDDLARLHLAARRVGCRISVRDACAEIREILELAGLDVLLGVEVGREAEDTEQVGVEEVVMPDDPVT